MPVNRRSTTQADKSVAQVAPFGGIDSMPGMYTAQLIVENGGQESINIKTPLPANFQFQLTTNYDNPFNQPISSMASQLPGAGAFISAMGTGMTTVTGQSTRSKWLSNQVWSGGNAFQISVPFVLQAQDNTAQEVVLIMRDMLKLVAPSESMGMLKAPGPNLGNTLGMAMSGDTITIHIGEFFTMTPCVINDVNIDFDTQMDVHSQCPMSAVVTISAISFWTTTKEDLHDYFKAKVN